MSEIVKQMNSQQSIALRKKHFETLMTRNRIVFLIEQHANCSAEEATEWLNSGQMRVFIEEYEDAFVEEQLVLTGLAEIVFDDEPGGYDSFYLDSDDCFHYVR